jgi:hypothetical protein
MSEFIEAEWFSGLKSVGAVLLYSEHYGFKCYIGVAEGFDKKLDIKHIAEHGAKMPAAYAAGLFGDLMTSEWFRRTMWDKGAARRCSFRYDGIYYSHKHELTEVKS